MNVKEYTDQKLKELRQKESKDVVRKRQDANTAEDRALTTKFWQAIKTRRPDKLEEVNDLIVKDYKAKGQTVGTIGSGTGGGILVPTTVADSIVSKMNYISPVRQMATVIPNMPAQLQLPSENTMALAYWVSEGVAPTASAEVFDPNMLTPYKLGGLDNFSSEVIADAATNPAIQNYVESRFAIALALKENDAFVNGDGSGKPYGFRSSAITPGSVSTAGDTVVYTDVTNVYYSLKSAYRQSAVFATSSIGMQALANVRDNQGRPIFVQSLVEGTPDRLMGRPIFLVDEIPSNLGAGTNTTELWFGYFGNYFVGDRGALRIDYGTNASDFANDLISLRMLKRVAGRPVIGESFEKLTGVL